MHAKGTLLKGLLFVLSSLSMSGPALATPIRVDVDGTVLRTVVNLDTGSPVLDQKWDGLEFAASFFIETEGLVKSVTASAATTVVRYLDPVGSPELVTSSLVVGGIDYSIGGLGRETGAITFIDSSGAGCSGCLIQADQFQLVDQSSENPLSADGVTFVPGSYLLRSLNFFSADPDTGTPPGLNQTDYFDLIATDDVLNVVNLDLGRIGLNYFESKLVCTAEACKTVSFSATNFEISNISRSIVSIPEPLSGTLLSAGLLALVASGRRKPLISRVTWALASRR